MAPTLENEAVVVFLAMVSAGVWEAGSVWLVDGEVVAPDLADAVLTTEPASRSAWVVD